jgi:Cu/Zn superoxide dismutase
MKHGIVNPFGKTHGAPSDETRHVGDLGNFKTDGQGNGKGSTTDKLIKLIGPESVIGVRLTTKFSWVSINNIIAYCCRPLRH